MTYGPPPEPNAHPGPPQPHPHPQQPGPAYPQHLWPTYAQQPVPAGPPKGGALLGLAAVILGLAGLAAPLLPMNMDGFRQYAAFPFALPGIALAIAALTGHRGAKPLGAIGAILCALALAVGTFMVITLNFNL
jgi:hypothetical protein